MSNDIKTINNVEQPKKGRKRGRRKKGEELLINPIETVNYIIKHWPYIGVKEIKSKILSGLKIQRDINENYSVLEKFIYNKKIYLYDKRNTILDKYGQYVGFFIDQENGSKKIYFLDTVYDNRTYDEIINDIENNIPPKKFIRIDNNIVIKREAKKRGRKKGKRKKDDKFLIRPVDVIDYIHSCWPQLEINLIKDKVIKGIRKEKEKGKEYYVLDKFIYKNNIYWVDNRNTILDNDANFVAIFIDNDNGSKQIYFIEPKNTDNRTYDEVIKNIENNN